MTRPPRLWPCLLTPCLLITGAAGAGRSAEGVWPPPAVDQDHVYVFLVNGIDLAHVGGLARLGQCLRGQGYRHTYYAEVFRSQHFCGLIRRIHRADPAARFVLIGFSVGANRAAGIAEAVGCDGVQVDLMVFLSGNHWLGGLPAEPPANVCRVVNVLSGGPLGRLGQRDWAENYQLPDTWHFGTPTHPGTRRLLTRVLYEVAVP